MRQCRYWRVFALAPDIGQGTNFVFSKLVPVTWILALANVLVYVVMVFKGGTSALLKPTTTLLINMGASYGPSILVLHEYWRLLTAAFVHASILHLAINVYALVAIGMVLEPRLGMVRFLLVYLSSALGGAVVSLAVNPFNISAGASGAIFGILTCVMILRWREGGAGVDRKFTFFVAVLMIVYSLGFGYITPGVDTAAHVGGLITGALLAFALIPVMVPLKAVGARDAILALAVATVSFGIVGWEYMLLSSNPRLISEGFAKETIDYLNQNANADAARVADSALALGMNSPAFHAAKAAQFDGEKKYQEALAACEKGLAACGKGAQVDKRSKIVLAIRANVRHRMGDDLGAVADNSAVIAIDPSEALPYNNRAWSYLALGEPEKAIVDARKALELNPRMATACDTLGLAYAYAGKFQEAYDSLSKAITTGPADGAYYYHRARVLTKLGRSADAEADQKELAAHPYEVDDWEKKNPLP